MMMNMNYEIINTKILNVSPIYLKLPGESDPNVLGAYGLPKLAELVDKVKNKIIEYNNPKDAKGLI